MTMNVDFLIGLYISFIAGFVASILLLVYFILLEIEKQTELLEKIYELKAEQMRGEK